jgi:hypothetical protein
MHVCMFVYVPSPQHNGLCANSPPLHSTPLKRGANKAPQVIRPSFQPIDVYTLDTIFSVVVVSLAHLHTRPISMTKPRVTCDGPYFPVGPGNYPLEDVSNTRLFPR